MLQPKDGWDQQLVLRELQRGSVRWPMEAHPHPSPPDPHLILYDRDSLCPQNIHVCCRSSSLPQRWDGSCGQVWRSRVVLNTTGLRHLTVRGRPPLSSPQAAMWGSWIRWYRHKQKQSQHLSTAQKKTARRSCSAHMRHFVSKKQTLLCKAIEISRSFLFVCFVPAAQISSY